MVWIASESLPDGWKMRTPPGRLDRAIKIMWWLRQKQQNFFSATKSSSSLRTGNILRAGDLLSSLPSTIGQSVGVFLVKTIISNCWQFQHQKQKMLEFHQKFPGYRSSHTLWISAKRSKHELQGSQKTRSPSWGSRWRRTAGGLLTTFLSTGSTKYLSIFTPENQILSPR